MNHKPTNKMTGFAGKEESSIIQMKNDDSFSNDPSKVVDLNVCIKSQKEVSSNAKNYTAKNNLDDSYSLVKNTIFAAGNVESSKNKTTNNIVFDKNFSENEDLNDITESKKRSSYNSKNEIMNAKERKHLESDIEEDAINTTQKQKS